jgi:hypothetical protein
LTLGGAPILMAWGRPSYFVVCLGLERDESDGGGGLILVLSVGSAASLSQQRNKGAQAVFTQEQSTPEHHADVDGKQDLAEE